MKNDVHIRLDDDNLNHLIELINISNKSKNYLINEMISLGIKYNNFIDELKSINNSLFQVNQNLIYLKELLRQLFANIDIKNLDVRYNGFLKEFDKMFYNRKLNE